MCVTVMKRKCVWMVFVINQNIAWIKVFVIFVLYMINAMVLSSHITSLVFIYIYILCFNATPANENTNVVVNIIIEK